MFRLGWSHLCKVTWDRLVKLCLTNSDNRALCLPLNTCPQIYQSTPGSPDMPFNNYINPFLFHSLDPGPCMTLLAHKFQSQLCELATLILVRHKQPAARPIGGNGNLLVSLFPFCCLLWIYDYPHGGCSLIFHWYTCLRECLLSWVYILTLWSPTLKVWFFIWINWSSSDTTKF